MSNDEVIVCEVCGEILTEKTKDLSGMLICRSQICGIAVRRGVVKEGKENNAEEDVAFAA